MIEHLTYSEQVNYPFADNAGVHALLRSDSTQYGETSVMRMLLTGLVDAAFTVPNTLAEWNIFGRVEDATRGRPFTLYQICKDAEYLYIGVGYVSGASMGENRIALHFPIRLDGTGMHATGAHTIIPAQESWHGATGVLAFDTSVLQKYLRAGYWSNIGASTYNLPRVPFSPRVHTPEATQVKRIVGYNDHNDWFTADGGLGLQEGCNIALSDVGNNTIRIDAAPGAGRGQLPCFPVDSPLSDETIITGDDCYSVTTTNNGIIKLEHRCEPCCPCEDYTWMLERLQGMAGRLKALEYQFIMLADHYNTGVIKFETFTQRYACVVHLTAARGVTYNQGVPARYGMSQLADSAELIQVAVCVTNMGRLPTAVTKLTFEALTSDGVAVAPTMVTDISRQSLASAVAEPTVINGNTYGAVGGDTVGSVTHVVHTTAAQHLVLELTNAAENQLLKGRAAMYTVILRENPLAPRFATLRARVELSDGAPVWGAAISI